MCLKTIHIWVNIPEMTLSVVRVKKNLLCLTLPCRFYQCHFFLTWSYTPWHMTIARSFKICTGIVNIASEKHFVNTTWIGHWHPVVWRKVRVCYMPWGYIWVDIRGSGPWFLPWGHSRCFTPLFAPRVYLHSTDFTPLPRGPITLRRLKYFTPFTHHCTTAPSKQPKIEFQAHVAGQTRTSDLPLTSKWLGAPIHPGLLLCTHILWYKKKEVVSGMCSYSTCPQRGHWSISKNRPSAQCCIYSNHRQRACWSITLCMPCTFIVISSNPTQFFFFTQKQFCLCVCLMKIKSGLVHS